MAWTDQCKIDACSQIQHKIERENLSVNKACKILSLESGIPAETIRRWTKNALVNNDQDDQSLQEKLKEQNRALIKQNEMLAKKLVIPPAWPTKKYKTIVIDPPWPMKKIQREVRPKQTTFDYPTMQINEIIQLPVETLIHKDGSHLYLWTTQKFLPNALMIARAWGFNYQCLLTWIKNVGPTPFSWMYSTEYVVFGSHGGLSLLKKGIRLDFNGKVREHSRKPDEFYDLVKEASPGPRIDIFSREKREGFDQYGDESSWF